MSTSSEPDIASTPGDTSEPREIYARTSVLRDPSDASATLTSLPCTAITNELAPGAGLDAALLAEYELRRGRSVRLVTVERDGAVAGAALLTVPKGRPIGARTATIAGSDIFDRAGLPVDSSSDEVAHALAQALLEETRTCGASRFHVEQLPADDPVVNALTSAAVACERSEADPIPLVRWTSEVPWAGKKTRNKYRGALRKLDAAGVEWRVETLTDEESILAAMPGTLELRTERELALGRADAFADASVRDLHLARVSALASKGDAELWRLFINGTLTAFAVAGYVDGRTEMLDSRIRPGFEEHAPGMVLFGAMTHTWFYDGFTGTAPGRRVVVETGEGQRRAETSRRGPSLDVAKPVTIVDFGRGTSNFKRQFHTEDEQTVSFTAWPSTAARLGWTLAEAAGEAARRPARLARRRLPMADKAFRRIRERQTDARRRRSRGGEHGSSTAR